MLILYIYLNANSDKADAKFKPIKNLLYQEFYPGYLVINAFGVNKKTFLLKPIFSLLKRKN